MDNAFEKLHGVVMISGGITVTSLSYVPSKSSDLRRLTLIDQA